MGAAGYDVWREFYVNDAGNQIEKFGISLETRYLQIYLGEDQVPFPEDGYQGEDIKDRAANLLNSTAIHLSMQIPKFAKKPWWTMRCPKNIDKMQNDLTKYGITYDQWFLESTIHNNGELEETIEEEQTAA